MEENKYMQDSIDRLPDELLIPIVSRLPVVEAARTSILAQRWRYFWFFNVFLNFDGGVVRDQMEEQRPMLERERMIFVNWVVRVLNLHSGATIEEFRIKFDLNKSYAKHIDKWIEFAFRKRVKKLELKLVETYTGIHNGQYTFPNMCDPIERLRILPLGLSSCESLVTLSLTGVDVTEEVVVFFITNCPFLEELCIQGSDCLGELRTNCPALRLRHLEILNCRGFEGLEINSPNLLSYTFYGMFRIPMALNNIASLITLSFGALAPRVLFFYLIEIADCLSRLETLMLHALGFKKHQVFPKSPHLPRLQKLIIDVCVSGYESIVCFASLIHAAPLLREIVLKLTWSNSMIHGTICQYKGFRHCSLEALQIEGFAGAKPDLELALYVIEHAVSLKRIIIDFREPLAVQEGGMRAMEKKMAGWRRQSGDAMGTTRMEMATKGVDLLKEKLPSVVELIVR